MNNGHKPAQCPKCLQYTTMTQGAHDHQCLKCGLKWNSDPIEAFIRETEILGAMMEGYRAKWGNWQSEVDPTPEQQTRIEAACKRINGQ